MPIYHLEAKMDSRGAGRFGMAALAYLSCSRMLNDYDGVQHDYTRKQGLAWQVVFLPLMAPPEMAGQRKTLERCGESGENQGQPPHAGICRRTAHQAVTPEADRASTRFYPGAVHG